MHSPFSEVAACSRLSWGIRKSSRSEDYGGLDQEPAIHELCPEFTTDETILDPPFKVRDSDVVSWAGSMSPFVFSSVGLALPSHMGQKYIRKYISTVSSAGSLLSESSRFNEESKGPKTPTFSDWSSSTEGLPDDADVRLAIITRQQPPTTKAQPKIHRAFSFELIPEAPLRPVPLPPPSLNTRNETAANLAVGSSNTPPCPDFSTASGCQATITQLIDEFMPEYTQTPQTTLARKKTSFPLLKINTRGFHTPLGDTIVSELNAPIIKLLPIIDHDARMLSLGYKAYSESRAEQDRALLSFSERETLSLRHSVANPIPRKNIAYDEYRKDTTRYSVQMPSKRLLNDMHEQKLSVPTQYKPYSAPQPILRRSPAKVEVRMSLEQRAAPGVYSAPGRYIAYSTPEIKRKQTPAEREVSSRPVDVHILEDIPAPLFTKRTEPVAVAKPRDLFLTGDFIAKDQGLQLKMTRVVTTFSKLEWVIYDLSGLRRLKCFAPSNSLSSRKDFLDAEDNPLFNFQKRIGKKRIATTPLGAEVFSVHSASLPSLPQWTVKLAGSISDTGVTVQWDAKGRGTETVVVRQAGVEVGRIRCESGQRRHSYIVSIAKGENHVVMAALATVFDDLRTDEGW